MGCAPSKESSKKGGVGTNQSIGALHERVTLTRHTEGVNIWDSYEIVENIAQGSTCEVFTIRQKSKGSGENHKKDTTIYVCKQISKEAVSDLIIAEMRNELSILQRMDHPNIVRVYETFENKRFIYLVMECMSGGDLFSRKGYTEGQAAKIMTQVTSAIAFCHQNCVIHRDLKMENIMFDNKSPDSDITVIDFGLSANYIRTKNGDSATMKDKVGTMYTIAPEVLKGEYNQKADVSRGIYHVCWTDEGIFLPDAKFYCRCGVSVSLLSSCFRVNSLLRVKPTKKWRPIYTKRITR